MYVSKTLVDLGPGRTRANCNTFDILTKNNLGEITQISVKFLHGLERETKRESSLVISLLFMIAGNGSVVAFLRCGSSLSEMCGRR